MTTEATDIKPRSRQVTDGIEATTSRGMLRGVGIPDAIAAGEEASATIIS